MGKRFKWTINSFCEKTGSRQKRNTTLWRHHNLDELRFHSSQVAVTTQTLICNILVLQSVKNKNNKPSKQKKPQKAKNQTNQTKIPPKHQKKPSPNQPTKHKKTWRQLFYFLTLFMLMNLRQGMLLILHGGHSWFWRKIIVRNTCCLYIPVDEAEIVRDTVFFMKKCN